MKNLFKHSLYIFLTIVLTTCSKDSGGGSENPNETTQFELTINVTPEGGGTVSPATGKFNKGQQVTLTVSSSQGYVFKNWTGSVSTSDKTIDITMDSNKSITANFEEIENFATYIIPNDIWIENFIELDTTDFSIQFKKEIISSYDFQTGDVIVSTVDVGLLRRISNTSINANELTVNTEFVTIEEAFEDLQEERAFTLVPDFEDKNFWLSNGVTMSKSTSKGQFSITLNETLVDPENSNSSIELTGNYDLDVDFVGIIDVTKFNIREFDVTYDLQQSKSLITKFQSLGVFEREKRIGYIPCGHIALGPIIISPIIEVFAGVKTNYNGSVQLGATEDHDNSINIEYNGQEWIYSENSSKTIELDPVELQASGDLQVYIEPRITFLLYGAIGPYLNAELYGRAAGVATNDNLNYEACLGANIGVGVKADILGLNIFDFDTDIYTYEECPIEGEINLSDSNEKTFIPDDGFEQALIALGYDNDMDNYVLTENITSVDSLLIGTDALRDLTGIEDFVSLEYLFLASRNLTSLDLTGNISLRNVELPSCQLSNLNLSGNPNLEGLRLDNNPLTSLDISNNPNLRYLNIRDNQIASIDLGQNPLLEILVCERNGMVDLDVSQNPLLRALFCDQNGLTELDLTQNTELSELWCTSNSLSYLDISNTAIEWELQITNNPFICVKVNEEQFSHVNTIAWIGNNPDANFSLDCNDSSGVELDPNGLSPDINALVPEYIIDEIINQGMTINTGGTPPTLNDAYLAKPFVLIGSSVSGDVIGEDYQDFKFKFYNQNSNLLTINLDVKSEIENGSGYGSFIVGQDNDFSVFAESIVTNQLNQKAKTIIIISGSLANNGVSDVKVAAIMIDNYGNPGNNWIPNGSGRVFEDEDGFSELLNSFKTVSGANFINRLFQN